MVRRQSCQETAGKLYEKVGSGDLQELTLTMKRVGGSFGVQLAHYTTICNVVSVARETDCPLMVDDIIVAIGDVSIVAEKIDAHLPSGDTATVTVLRPKPGTLQDLLSAALGLTPSTIKRATSQESSDGGVDVVRQVDQRRTSLVKTGDTDDSGPGSPS